MQHDLKTGVRSLREGLDHARARYWTVRYYERLRRERDRAFSAYLSCSPRGLHIGAATVALEHWFNTDLDPRTPGIHYLDATQPFPFPDRCFDFIFFEHMVEHIPFDAGLQLLAECKRVLKPAGVVRIATPNLCNILALIATDDANTERYLRWAVETFRLPNGRYPKAPMVINNFFRAWGHQFLYDPETLRETLAQSGFHDIVQQKPGESAHPDLRGLERHGNAIGEWTNEFETMVFEGTAS